MPKPGALHLIRGTGKALEAKAARAAEQQFTSAFENAAIGMTLISCQLQRLRVNRAFCDMLGYSKSELMSLSVLDITHPDDARDSVRLRDQLLAGELESYQREKRYLHRTGRVIWGLLTCTLVRSAQGQPLHFISQVQDITERKQAEQALRESEERFRSLTMLSSDWFWEQDQAFRFTSFSGASRNGFWQPDQKTALGRRRWELPGIFPLSGTWEQHRATLEAHLPFRDFEYVRTLGDGPPRYLSASGEPVHDCAGNFIGYRGIAREVTQAKVAEQRLRDMQGMLHMAARVGRLGGWAWDVRQPVVTWSQEVCAIHEVGQDFQPTPQQAIAFVAPEHRQAMRAVVRACARDGTPFDVEAQIITARGRRLWTRVIGEGEWDAVGRVRRVQGACQDISDIRDAAERARTVAQQLTTTLESLTDAFFTVDREWRFTYVNGEAERLLRRPRNELLGRHMWQMFPNLRESQFSRSYEKALAEHVTVQFEDYYPAFGIWVQVKAYPSSQGLAIYIKDVSSRIAAQQEILRLNAELEERVRRRTAELEAANRELEAFSYSIAHDLRAPLSSIDGFSQILQHTARAGLGERSSHYLNRIRAGVRQMGELTDGLLALANLSRTSIRSEPADLAVLARAAIASCRERTPERHVDVRIESALPAHGDPRLLSQVIGNLVGNAWKFTSRTGQPRIEVGSQVAREETVYFVRDNGAGFDMAYASKMFEAFHRMHTALEFEGTGIGLAIVQKIIVRHGGRIWAEAAPQQGACFYFTLPAQAGAA
jgi:hypothetical protein